MIIAIVIIAVAATGAWLRWACAPVTAAYRIGRIIGSRQARP